MMGRTNVCTLIGLTLPVYPSRTGKIQFFRYAGRYR
jgi:hypothetical protein